MEIFIIMTFYCLLGLGLPFYIFFKILKRNEEKENIIIEEKQKNLYKNKNIMTKCEKDFYIKIKELEPKYKIIPQVNLATIIQKVRNNKYINELFRNIDFAIFSNDFEKLLLLIELNDSTHNEYKRRNRDLKVKNICNECNIKLLTFYTKYPNQKDYVINRILNEIEPKEIIESEIK